jgi:hypothetical protein
MEIPHNGCLAGKAGALLEFFFSKEPAVFLPVELGPSGLDKDHAFSAFPLSATDHVDVHAGTLGGIEDGGSTFNFDLAITREKGNSSHLVLPLLVQEFPDLSSVAGSDKDFPAGCILDPS